MEIESTELQQYVTAALLAIKSGVGSAGFHIATTVEFNLAVTNTKEGGGGLKIYVAKAEGKLMSEEITHIKFEAKPDSPMTASQFRPERSNSAR